MVNNLQNVLAKVKNVGSAPRILYSVSMKAHTIMPGEIVTIELRVKEARRLRELALRGDTLRILNPSDAEPPMLKDDPELRDAAGKPQGTIKPGVKEIKKPSGVEPREPDKVIRPEIRTASQALAAMNDGEELPWNQLLAVANRLLRDDMPAVRNKANIMKALEAAAQKE